MFGPSLNTTSHERTTKGEAHGRSARPQPVIARSSSPPRRHAGQPLRPAHNGPTDVKIWVFWRSKRSQTVMPSNDGYGLQQINARPSTRQTDNGRRQSAGSMGSLLGGASPRPTSPSPRRRPMSPGPVRMSPGPVNCPLSSTRQNDNGRRQSAGSIGSLLGNASPRPVSPSPVSRPMSPGPVPPGPVSRPLSSTRQTDNGRRQSAGSIGSLLGNASPVRAFSILQYVDL